MVAWRRPDRAQRLLATLRERVYARLDARTGGAARLVRALTGYPGYPVAYNVNGSSERTHGQRALLLYRLKAFRLREADHEFFSHHNLRGGRLIAAVLAERGYTVDVANGIDSRRRRPAGRYDLVICDRADLRGELPAGATGIFLATTIEHRAHNASLRRRHARLAERRPPPVRPRRIYEEKMPYARAAHAIMAIGNELTGGSWRTVGRGPVHRFNNHGYPETEFAFEGKNFVAARRHFLFYAGGSQVQKGLDLLLEVFPRRPDLHLYVCSPFESEAEFCACYRKELYETANVHPVGWVLANGPTFRELAQRCAFIIHPSCSDGQAGAVVHGMYAGLIPMVTREAGFDPEDVGVTFADDSLEEIDRAIAEVARQPASWHADQSRRARRIAESTYSEEAFRDRWHALIDQLPLAGRPR